MKENGFEYVDLSLPSGTMWATCNVGADKPEDEGLLFQFGRVDGYKYGDTNHKIRTNKQNKQDTENEFIPKTTSGKLYCQHNILDLADDAAHVNMGDAWRMPTRDEIEELLDNTTQKVETINGVQGMMFTSKINSNQLFIPFMQGSWYDVTWFSSAGSNVSVWSSQVIPSNVIFAYRLYCNSSGNAIVGSNFRSFAFSVRGVFKSNVKHNEYNSINMLI